MTGDNVTESKHPMWSLGWRLEKIAKDIDGIGVEFLYAILFYGIPKNRAHVFCEEFDVVFHVKPFGVVACEVHSVRQIDGDVAQVFGFHSDLV